MSIFWIATLLIVASGIAAGPWAESNKKNRVAFWCMIGFAVVGALFSFVVPPGSTGLAAQSNTIFGQTWSGTTAYGFPIYFVYFAVPIITLVIDVITWFCGFIFCACLLYVVTES